LVANQGFTDSATMRMYLADYRDETTPVRRFLKEYTVQKTGARVTPRELYDLYVLWAQLEGHSRQSAVTFGRDATAFFRSIEGIERKKANGVRFFEGVMISPDGHDELSERAASRN
jgi:phage/plasmid-associated DNA primase